MTANFIKNLLETNGREYKKDFFLAFSSERVNPGDTSHQWNQVSKVIGADDPKSRLLATEFYKSLGFRKLHITKGTREAELSKLIGNSYRAINIAFVNELSKYSKKMNIDIKDAIDAAATKTFGFQRFDPGVGVGGNCINADPRYLIEEIRRSTSEEFLLLEEAMRINSNMPRYIADYIDEKMEHLKIPISQRKVLWIGVAYKPGVSLINNSPNIEVLKILRERGWAIAFYDDKIDSFSLGEDTYMKASLNLINQDYSLIVYSQPQTSISLETLESLKLPIIDLVRNSTSHFSPFISQLDS